MSTMPSDQTPGSQPESRFWRRDEAAVLILLGLAFGFAYFDRMALTFLAPFVQEDLGLSNEQVGWANSGLSATWALGAFLIGRWSDLIGRRKPFLIGALVLFSLCSVLSGLASSFETLLAARIVMGAAEGPFLPICLAIMAAASAPGRQALNAGIVQNVFGPIVGTALASYALVRIAAAYDWHAAFYIAGIPGLVLAVLIWRFVDEPPRAEGAAYQPPAGGLFPLALLKQRNILLCSAVSCCAVGSIVVGSIFMPLYLDGPRGYDALTWSNVMTAVGFCPAVGAIVIALLSERIGRKPPLIVFAFLMVLAPAALLWFDGTGLVPAKIVWFDGPVLALTVLMFVSWMGLGTFPLFMGVIPTETVGRAQAATAMGVVVMLGELTGGVFGPPIAGRMADLYGLDFALYLQGGLALLAGVAAMFVVETNPQVLARRAPAR